MILYIIFAEIFLENIKQNNVIKIIVTDENELKMLLSRMQKYETIGNNNSLAHLGMHPRHFRKVTDIKFNKTKFMGIYLGYNRGNPRKPLGFK